MIDRAELSQRYRTAAIRCGLVGLIPVSALGLSLVLGPGQSTGPDALTPDPMLLAVLGVSCLLPVVVVPVFRRYTRGKLPTPATPREATAAQGSAIASLAVIECYFWAFASVWGFLAVMSGGAMTFAYIGAVISVSGIAYSFPRWTAVSTRADELERMSPVPPIAPR